MLSVAAGCWVALLAGAYVTRVVLPNFVPVALWDDAVRLAAPSFRCVSAAAGSFAGSIALVVALLAAAAGQGAAWIRLLRAGPPRGGDPLIAMAVGLGVAGTASYALGFLGLYRPAALAASLAAGAAIGAGPLLRAIRSAGGPARGGAAARVAGWCALIAWAGCVLAAPAPETEMDSLKYHLGKPRQYLLQGRIAPNPGVFFRFPSLWEATLTPLLGLGGEPAAKLLQPAVVGFLGLLVWSAMSRVRPGAGVLAAALVVAGYGTGRIAVTAKNDVFVALLVFAAFASILDPRRRGPGRFLVAGIALGFALSAKSTALLGAAAVGAGYLAGAGRLRAAAPGLLAVGACLGYAPWGVRNWLEAGNPVYPFASALFQAGMPPASEALLREETHRYTAASYAALPDKLRAPWSLAIAEGLWLLPALALPAGLLLFRRGPGRAWAAAGLTALAVFAAGPPQPRFLLQGMPMLAGALELSLPVWRGGAGPPVLAAFVALDAIRGWSDYWSDRGGRIAVTAGCADPDRYRLEKLTTYAHAVRWVDERLPATAHVLIFGPTRLFPIARRATLRTDYERLPPLALAEASRDAAHLRRKLRQQGWTHLFYDRLNAVAWAEQMSRLTPGHAALARWERVWRDRAALIYESPVVDLRQGGFMIWDLRGPANGGARFVLPGSEAFAWEPAVLARAGRMAEARREFDRLARVAGPYALTRQAEVATFEGVLPRAEARRRLEAVAATGFRSVWLFSTLARYLEEAGEPSRAAAWRARADALAYRQEAWLR